MVQTLDAPQSTETDKLREYQMQLTKEWQTYHTENYALAYLRLAFTGFISLMEYRKACSQKTVPKAKQKICIGNHKHSVFINIQEWANSPHSTVYEKRAEAKLEL